MAEVAIDDRLFAGIKNCMQKSLQKELGRSNIRVSIRFLRILAAHEFDMGNAGLIHYVVYRNNLYSLYFNQL